MTEPINQVIPRKIPEVIASTLTLFKETIEELVNYGSHILKWDLEIKDPNRKDDAVPPIMLLRHYLDTLDSIGLLVEKGSGDTAKILLRALFETFLGLIYLFENDSKNRAMAYMINDVLAQIKLLKKFNPDVQEGQDLNKILAKEVQISPNSPEIILELKQEIFDKESVLTLPEYEPLYKEYQRLKKKKISNPSWYQYFDGPSNIKSLAAHLGYQSLYEVCYRSWSGMVHGSDVYLGKISNSSSHNKVEVVQLRYFKDVQEIVRYAQYFTTTVFKKYLQSRVPDKSADFEQWLSDNNVRLTIIYEKNLIKISGT